MRSSAFWWPARRPSSTAYGLLPWSEKSASNRVSQRTGLRPPLNTIKLGRRTDKMNWSLVLLGCMSAGCIPLRPTVREARSGVVLDAQTGAPVVGATVRVESYRVAVPPGYGGHVTLLDGTEV